MVREESLQYRECRIYSTRRESVQYQEGRICSIKRDTGTVWISGNSPAVQDPGFSEHAKCKQEYPSGCVV